MSNTTVGSLKQYYVKKGGNLSDVENITTIPGMIDAITALPGGGDLPKAGTTGQVLTKASDADFDAEWVTPGGGTTGHWTREELDIVNGYYVRYEDGNLSALENAKYAVLEVAEGEKYKVTGSFMMYSALYAMYNGDQFVSAYPNEYTGSYTTETAEITIPAGVTTLKVSSIGSNNILEVYKWAENSYVTMQDLEDINGIEEYSDYEFVDQPITLENKYLYRTTGVFFPHDECRGGSIPVSEGEVYQITAKDVTANLAIYYFFDGNGTAVGHFPSDDSASNELQTIVVTVPHNAVQLSVSSWGANNLQLKKRVATDTKLRVSTKSNILYGKKWAACGDSFTAGDFTNYVDKNGQSGQNSDAYDPVTQHYKTYPWWIAGRNDMDVQWLAMGGNDFTNIEGATRPFSNPNTATYNYTQIANDCDYITLMFGLNENGMTAEQIGTKTDSDNTTLWGAYNVVLEAILTANPIVKIGIIISDDGLSQTYHDALIDIAKYWGIPYLDLRNGEQVPMMIGGRLDEVSQVAKTLRNNAFKCSASDIHPNVVAHEYRSTVIEQFLRSL